MNIEKIYIYLEAVNGTTTEIITGEFHAPVILLMFITFVVLILCLAPFLYFFKNKK